MKFGKIILVVLLLASAFNSSKNYAQNTEPAKQIRILNNYGRIPFEDGKTVIAGVKFIGLDGDEEYDETVERKIPESDFRKLLRDRRATIDNDDKFYGYKVSKVVNNLKQWIASVGFVDVKVAAFGEELPKNRMNLIFKIERRELARISEIRFERNINADDEELVVNFKQCSGDNWKIFDVEKYDYYAQQCSRKFLLSKGYFEAKIKRIAPQIIDGYRIVTITVDEGIRYRIGEIKIEGAKVFTVKEILEMWGQSKGDVADGKLLQDFLYEKLKRNYADEGYILYNAEFDVDLIKPQIEGLDATVDISIMIDEGKRFKIRKIEFVGIKDEEAQDLKENFFLKENDVYNQSKFEAGIKKINEAKKLYIVDNDRNSEIVTDEESGEVSLAIKVYKLQQ